jgi:hypothetical protein
MSDGITEARRGTYWSNNKYNHDDSIQTWNTTSTNGQTTPVWQEPHREIQLKHMPNQKWHKYVSFIKSGVRIVGYGLIPFNLVAATIVLIFSEIIGIVEELV